MTKREHRPNVVVPLHLRYRIYSIGRIGQYLINIGGMGLTLSY